MASETVEKDYRVIATRCGSCGCGCPTVLESSDPDELVIVGRLDRGVLLSKTVKKHVGENEVAVVIPKSLLIEAAKSFA